MADQGLLHVLQQSLSADAAERSQAEQQLALGFKQGDIGPLLLQVVLARDVSQDVRQLATLVLKKYIKEHWDENARNFEPPVAPEAAKAMVRNAIPGGLTDPSSKIRTAVGMCIATICKTDWPNKWPGLLEWLVQQIRDRQDDNLGACWGLSCIKLMPWNLHFMSCSMHAAWGPCRVCRMQGHAARAPPVWRPRPHCI